MRDKPWSTEDWEVSPLNLRDDVRQGLLLKHPIEISDCTLREGEQQAGIALQVEEKVEIARALDELGIHQIEAGMPAVSTEEHKSLELICSAGLKARILAICRSTREDINIAANAGAWGVICSLPIGELQIRYKLGWSREAILERAVEITRYAHEKGLYVVLSPYDTTRADLEFLHQYLTTAYQYGHVDRIRVVDTVGAATPEAFRYLVRLVRETIPVSVEVHAHDDFGLANANVLAGLLAGANVASTSFFGLGERAGNAATEEVAMALRILYNRDIGVRLERLGHVADLIARHTRVRNQPHKAVIGENAHAQVSGLVVAGFLANPFTAQPYRARVVGREETLSLGKASGRASIEWKLSQAGLEGTPEQVDTLLGMVKTEGIRTKTTVIDERFREFARSVLGR